MNLQKCQESKEDADNKDNIEEMPEGGYKLVLHIPRTFTKHLIGKGQKTIRRICDVSKAYIQKPHDNDTNNNWLIKSNYRDHVNVAESEIRQVIGLVRRIYRTTHILVIPLNEGEVRQRYLEFKKCVMGAELNIAESLYQWDNFLHITLCSFTLTDENDEQQMLAELQNCEQFLNDSASPFDMRIKGIILQPGDPECTRKVWAHVEAPRLEQFSNKCVSHFNGFNLTNTTNRKSLHCTLIKNRFNKQLKTRMPRNFDASEILNRWGDYDFGNAQCNQVHLCRLGNTNKNGDFYDIIGTLKI
ncbi:uncharacterized protein LOC111518980 [Drosophila willistoni]|uniref:uncharacterized protein LOC111518980 n=1 Tax=Drosophila willistoni TaxID=7260 RepID=UPI000C26C5F1|nr:uncharacterized protein LOC111518980 [Drosophila willistoni]